MYVCIVYIQVYAHTHVHNPPPRCHLPSTWAPTYHVDGGDDSSLCSDPDLPSRMAASARAAQALTSRLGASALYRSLFDGLFDSSGLSCSARLASPPSLHAPSLPCLGSIPAWIPWHPTSAATAHTWVTSESPPSTLIAPKSCSRCSDTPPHTHTNPYIDIYLACGFGTKFMKRKGREEGRQALGFYPVCLTFFLFILVSPSYKRNSSFT